MSIKNLNLQGQKEELALLYQVERCTSQGAKRDFCKQINIPWKEYLRFCRKWRVVLTKYREENSDA